MWARLATGCTILAGLLAIEFGPAAVGCGIKGNISYNTGKKIITFLDRILLGDTHQQAGGQASRG